MKGEKSNILNKEFRNVYRQFIKYLMYKPKAHWTVANYLTLTYYLLL